MWRCCGYSESREIWFVWRRGRGFSRSDGRGEEYSSTKCYYRERTLGLKLCVTSNVVTLRRRTVVVEELKRKLSHFHFHFHFPNNPSTTLRKIITDPGRRFWLYCRREVGYFVP
jgi:hypothetical protein